MALKAMPYDFLPLLKARRFDELDKQLAALQKDAEAGANEWAVLSSFEQFSNHNEDYSPYFDEWVKHNKGLWTGRLARGIHHVAVALKKRGTKFIQKTPKENIKAMQHHFSAAKEDLYDVLETTPRSLVAYKMLLQAEKANGSDAEQNRLIKEVLKFAPDSYYVRWQYITGLEPKWGGSMSRIRKFAIKSQKSRERNPRVYALMGFQYDVKGDNASRDKKYARAVVYYSKALEYAPVGSWLRRRAYSYQKLKRYDEQIRDLSTLLEVAPDDSGLLGRRGYAYVKKKQYPSAIADLERSMELNPTRSYVSNNLGWIYNNKGEYKKAASYFDKTLAHKPDNTYALTYCGIVRVRLHQLEKAKRCLSHAVEVAPEDANAWRYYGDLLHTQGDPKHIEALENYLKYADRKKEKATYDKIKHYLEEEKAEATAKNK